MNGLHREPCETPSPKPPVVVDQLGPCSLKSTTSVDMPNTFGFNTVFHVDRVTVHGGNHFPRLAVLTWDTHVVSRADMVDAVLGSPFPLRTPRHWAPPQLFQVQMIIGYMACHIMNNVLSTIRTCISLPENCETYSCTPASVTPCRSVVVSSHSTEMWATVIANCSSLPLRLSDRSPRSYPQAWRLGTPGRCSDVRY